MPRPAQDRSQTGPLAALLILLGLLLGSGNAVAAGNGIGAPAARSSLGRQTPTNAILQSAARGTLGDEDGHAVRAGIESAPLVLRVR